MEKLMNIAILLFALAGVAFIIILSPFGSKYRLVSEEILVRQGYAEYQMNPTNGTSHFTWITGKNHVRP